jgi:hypothetical protein
MKGGEKEPGEGGGGNGNEGAIRKNKMGTKRVCEKERERM